MSGDDAGAPVEVIVRNSLQPPARVTVRLVSSSGRRLRLGVVPGAGQNTLAFRSVIGSSELHLVAEPDGQQPLTSHPFRLRPGGRVVWDLRPNLLRVLTAEELLRR